MPTGYTAGIADGTITDFKTFALQCARGMGALVMMRDEPWDAPIPERFEPSDYHKKELEKAKQEDAELESMDAAALKIACDSYNTESDEDKLKAAKRNAEQRRIYDSFIAQTQAWDGAPEGLKEFMLSQLEGSKGFDVSDDPTKYYSPTLSVGDFYAKRRKDIDWRLKYHAEEYAKEDARVEGRNVWLAQLRKSLEKY